MQKFCHIAIALSLSLISPQLLADTKEDVISPIVLAPESQHATASKRITAQFTRAHYKKIQMNDSLSQEIFDRYVKQLDYNRNVFLADDIKGFEKYALDFDSVIARGKLDIAYDMYNLNLQRRLERYQYALTLLDVAFDFTKKESYFFDREDAPWAKSSAELDSLWRMKVKYDALNLILAGKEWPKVQEVLTKRYK
jgi:carboxyl-terminal processing protease